MLRRIVRSPSRREIIQTGIDAITDPVQLAHALTNLEAQREELEYSRYLRVSSLYTVCVRERLLGLRNDVLKTKWISRDTVLLFEKGNYYHDLVQNTSLIFDRARIGWWECMACNFRRFGRPPTKPCRCGARKEAIRHKEHHLEIDDPFNVSGHQDLFLEVGGGDIRVLDVKSLDIDEMVKMISPKPENVYQVQGYMEFGQYDKNLPIKPNRNRGLLLYFAKRSRKGVFPIKMFHVVRQQVVVDAMTRDLNDFRRGLEDISFLPPPKDKCKDSAWNNYEARSCGALEFCRGRK